MIVLYRKCCEAPIRFTVESNQQFSVRDFFVAYSYQYLQMSTSFFNTFEKSELNLKKFLLKYH